MPLYKWSVLGEQLLGWGMILKDPKEAIPNLTDNQRAVCLLAAVLWRLGSLESRLARIETDCREARDQARREPSDPIADGCLVTLRSADGDRWVGRDDLRDLSGRARKALIALMGDQGGLHVSAITEDSVLGVPYCGRTTAREVLAWKARLGPADPGSCAIGRDGEGG